MTQAELQALCDEIEDCMKSDDFQRDFFESLKDQVESKGRLTEKQEASLQKIYDRVTS